MANVAELMILKLHPLFHYQSDVVFRELARQSDSWHFYHFRPTVSIIGNVSLIKKQPKSQDTWEDFSLHSITDRCGI